MLAPRASEIRKPFNASDDTSACSTGPARPAANEQGAELVAVQRRSVGLVVQAWPAHVHCRRAFDQAVLLGVLVEPREGAQPACDRGTGTAEGLHLAGVALDIDPPNSEQRQTLVGHRGPGVG
jgi:hypothetical protein